jgi:predicted glycoside hydrolase/deacetylase ChbG (UPF0249 family)
MIICADDFGMSDAINRAVLDLVAESKVTAVSCAVSHPSCSPQSVRQLVKCAQNVDIGLHLVLTSEGRPLAPSSCVSLATEGKFHDFGILLCRSYMRRLDRWAVQAEITAQYQRFEAMAGRPPHFIDGHLHVHQFPVIREALLDLVCELPPSRRPYVRNTRMSLGQAVRAGASLPKTLLVGTPGRAFRRRVMRCGVATNTGFAGVYNYRPASKSFRIFTLFLKGLPGPNDMLVVHPGLEERWRRREYEALRNWNAPSGIANRFRWDKLSSPNEV